MMDDRLVKRRRGHRAESTKICDTLQVNSPNIAIAKELAAVFDSTKR